MHSRAANHDSALQRKGTIIYVRDGIRNLSVVLNAARTSRSYLESSMKFMIARDYRGFKAEVKSFFT